MKNKRKGFTLIELLAVIVILAIIALIATPLVLKYIEKARQGAAESSILSYVEAIETEVAASQLKNNVYPDKENYNFDEIKVSVKGTKPTTGSYSLKKGMVESGKFCIDGYEVNYTIDGAKVTGSCDGKEQTCKEGMLCSKVKLGDYISMTTTSESYSLPDNSSFTDGYYSHQIINPSELNLWRVIRINNNGTIEMVSEYLSSAHVDFGYAKGYKNLVGGLNLLASKYENSKYTVSSRHMGYNGQTEYLIDTANTLDSTSTTPPWTSSTGSSTVESQGGGDMLYQTDVDLVKNALGTLDAYPVDKTETDFYWLASRYYYYTSTNWRYEACFVGYDSVYTTFLVTYNNGVLSGGGSSGKRIRPIVTLKSDISNFSGSGTSAEPWVLE